LTSTAPADQSIVACTSEGLGLVLLATTIAVVEVFAGLCTDFDDEADAARAVVVEVTSEAEEEIFTSPMMFTQLPTATRSWFNSERMVEMSTTTTWSALLLSLAADDDDAAVAGNLVRRMSWAR
jgi:hypothetical protein